MNDLPAKVWWVLAAVAVALSLLLVGLNVAERGFWEPWESALVEAAPVVETGEIGAVERRARLPLVFAMLVLMLATALFVQRYVSSGAAAATLVVMATAPVVYLGAIFLSGPLVYVATSTLAVLLFFHAVYGPKQQQLLSAVLAGGALTLVGLEQGLIGTLTVLATLFALALAQTFYDADREVRRALLGVRGLLLIALGVLPLLGIALSKTAGLELDEEAARSPLFAYLLESASLVESTGAEGNFSWWWRQVGFGLFPHVMFLVPALGYLAWKLGPEAKSSASERALAMLCLVWPAASFVVVAPAAQFGHTLFPAFFPLMLATGWMISDGDFWRSLRRRPAAYFFVALIAAFAVAVLAKDLENYPTRLVEFVLGGAENLGLADDHEYGKLLSRWKYLVVAMVVAYFGGAISWAVFGVRDLKSAKNQAVAWLKRWRREEVSPQAVDAADLAERITSPGERRMAEREAFRAQPGLLSRAARHLEELPGLVALVMVAGTGFMLANQLSFTAQLDEKLSSRAVVERYLALAGEEEALLRYQVEAKAEHFYVQGIEELENRRDLSARFASGERVFVLIPEERLAIIHSTVRRGQGEELVVLARGGGLLLVSNQLLDGEEDLNPLNEAVLDEPEESMIPLLVESAGQEVHPQFNRQIEFIGYRLDRGSKEERAQYRWGEEMEITMYFRVLRRIPASQRIFMHIDTAGNRIHGDHDPVQGFYSTNHWAPGDIIKNTHVIEIPRFSTPGVYTIRGGFFRGDDRMRVTPREAHDGQNRVDVATIEVLPF